MQDEKDIVQGYQSDFYMLILEDGESQILLQKKEEKLN